MNSSIILYSGLRILQHAEKRIIEMCNKYNGWTNYETWNVALWMDNEQYKQELWSSRVRELLEDEEEYPNAILQDELKKFVDDLNPLAGDASMYADLLSAAIDSVNWYEIAQSYLDDAKTELEQEETEE